MRRLSRQQWEEEQRAKYTGWDAAMRRLDALHGPPRKLRMLADENLEEVVVVLVSESSGFKVVRQRGGLEDRALWDAARREGLVLLTADRDFWDDRTYPLRDCPGVLLLVGNSGPDRAVAFFNAAAEWDLLRKSRTIPGFMAGLKILARPNGSSGKFWDPDGATVYVGI